MNNRLWVSLVLLIKDAPLRMCSLNMFNEFELQAKLLKLLLPSLKLKKNLMEAMRTILDSILTIFHILAMVTSLEIYMAQLGLDMVLLLVINR
jgi:hypothetical protein